MRLSLELVGECSGATTAGADSSEPSSVFLGRSLVLAGQRLFEAVDAAAEAAPDLRKPFGTEEQQDDKEHKQ
jgi:hypothetical protein